ncbi:FUSC family protein [Protaetiibacter larvae]|uniref:FUSC family protein n=1 Tax=Protaetiibacter larvae TaxID=2592654 RepID=A0A5C1Y6V0_9MICO|nr:FUSC family protein [Protaetiibacter larvae]QEO09541.1 FUSC family protein [Protaetiibacter larvae]
MASRPPSRWRRALVEALLTVAAVAATAGTAWLLAPEPGPVTLAGMLAMTLSRSQLERDVRGRVEAAIALPVIGLAAAGTGALLVGVPWAGAAVYVLAMFASVWVRRFGARWRRIGALLALPFIAVLIAPAPHPSGWGAVGAVFPAIIALVAFGWVTVLQLLARGLRMLPPAVPPTSDADRASTLRPSASTRLAIQLAASVAVAFVVGFTVFADRWAWIVLTVVVVALGNAGRADVLAKGVQRVAGAAVGTVLAVGCAGIAISPGAGVAVLAVALFLAVLLRPVAYLWWALFFTLALAVLQQLTGGGFVLGERLEEIALGTVLALAAAWFLLPVRTELVLRRRLGEVLAALQEGSDAELAAAVARLDKAAAPYGPLLRIRPGARRPRAAGWIAATRRALAGPRPPAARVGAARRAVREPDALQAALDALAG